MPRKSISIKKKLRSSRLSAKRRKRFRPVQKKKQAKKTKKRVKRRKCRRNTFKSKRGGADPNMTPLNQDEIDEHAKKIIEEYTEEGTAWRNQQATESKKLMVQYQEKIAASNKAFKGYNDEVLKEQKELIEAIKRSVLRIGEKTLKSQIESGKLIEQAEEEFKAESLSATESALGDFGMSREIAKLEARRASPTFSFGSSATSSEQLAKPTGFFQKQRNAAKQGKLLDTRAALNQVRGKVVMPQIFGAVFMSLKKMIETASLDKINSFSLAQTASKLYEGSKLLPYTGEGAYPKRGHNGNHLLKFGITCTSHGPFTTQIAEGNARSKLLKEKSDEMEKLLKEIDGGIASWDEKKGAPKNQLNWIQNEQGFFEYGVSGGRYTYEMLLAEKEIISRKLRINQKLQGHDRLKDIESFKKSPIYQQILKTGLQDDEFGKSSIEDQIADIEEVLTNRYVIADKIKNWSFKRITSQELDRYNNIITEMEANNKKFAEKYPKLQKKWFTEGPIAWNTGSANNRGGNQGQTIRPWFAEVVKNYNDLVAKYDETCSSTVEGTQATFEQCGNLMDNGFKQYKLYLDCIRQIQSLDKELSCIMIAKRIAKIQAKTNKKAVVKMMSNKFKNTTKKIICLKSFMNGISSATENNKKVIKDINNKIKAFIDGAKNTEEWKHGYMDDEKYTTIKLTEEQIQEDMRTPREERYKIKKLQKALSVGRINRVLTEIENIKKENKNFELQYPGHTAFKGSDGIWKSTISHFQTYVNSIGVKDDGDIDTLDEELTSLLSLKDIASIEKVQGQAILDNDVEQYADLEHKADIRKALSADRELYTQLNNSKNTNKPDAKYHEIDTTNMGTDPSLGEGLEAAIKANEEEEGNSKEFVKSRSDAITSIVTSNKRINQLQAVGSMDTISAEQAKSLENDGKTIIVDMGGINVALDANDLFF
jgi:hypothetical protein